MINRRLLDFDFEKTCSVTLSPLNCYACLSCGKYFQGRGEGTPAFMHALHHSDHVLYLNLKTLKVYTLPDNVEYEDSGQLDDVRAVIKPKFTRELLKEIDERTKPLNDLQGKPFLPGFVGLNQIKANDYVNVILQALAHIRPLRDSFLLKYSGKQGTLGEAFKEVIEKIWNPTRFKAQTSPHEFLQAISTASSKRFSLVKQSDPLDFLTFLLNNLSRECPILTELLQGRVRIDSCDISHKSSVEPEMKSDVKPFFFLSLDLPVKPLFADPRNPTAIPQISLTTLLEKYNGGTFTYKQTTASAYSVQKYPKYLILHINRFVKNNFVIEHNPTIVQFSPNNLALPVDPNAMSDTQPPIYNLLANVYSTLIKNDADDDRNEKCFGVQLKCPATDSWLEIENLLIKEAQVQMLFMSESYIQVWERVDNC